MSAPGITRQEFSFRVVVGKVVQELTPENLHTVAFVYDKDKHLEMKKEVDGHLLFRDIIREGDLKYDDGAHIARLIELLRSFKRSDLAEQLIKYCHDWNVEVSPYITTTGTPETNPPPDMEQEGVSSTDDSQKKKVMGSVVLLEEKPPASTPVKANTTAPDICQNRPIPFNRKRKKLDIGAADERQLGLEGDYQSSDEAGEDDEPVDPHDQEDEEYMKQAIDEAENSPDEDVKVGTVIVNYEKILSRGHNRMPDGCESLPWDDNEQNLYTSKYPYVFHSFKAALKNVFMNNMQEDLKGATVYTTLFPANSDAHWIADLGMKEIVYLDNPYKRKTFSITAKRIFDVKGIKCRRMAWGFERQY